MLERGALGHQGTAFPQGGCHPPSCPQDLEISVKELQTILNRIISKRERPSSSPPCVLTSSKPQNLGFCSHIEPNPSPWSLWVGEALLTPC